MTKNDTPGFSRQELGGFVAGNNPSGGVDLRQHLAGLTGTVLFWAGMIGWCWIMVLALDAWGFR